MQPEVRPEGGGLKSFLVMVLVLLALILALVVALAMLGGDGGLLEFDYEGA